MLHVFGGQCFTVSVYYSSCVVCLQCERGLSDTERDPGHHPGHGDQRALGPETADSRDREADQGAEPADLHNHPHRQQARRRDHHRHHQQL